MIADTVGPAARVGVAGAIHQRRELAAALSAHGADTLVPPSGEWAIAAERGGRAGRALRRQRCRPSLAQRGQRSIARARPRRRATWLRSPVQRRRLFVVAAVVELWGVHRQLGTRARRARADSAAACVDVGRTHAPSTRPTAISRRSAASSARRRIGRRHRDAQRRRFPTTRISRRSARAMTRCIVDGLAEHAARVFDALEQAHGLIERQRRGARAARAAGRRRRRSTTSRSRRASTRSDRVAVPRRRASNSGRAEDSDNEVEHDDVARSARRDDRRRRCCSLALLFIWGVRPYQTTRLPTRATSSRPSARRWRASARRSRRRGRTRELQHVADSAMRAMRPRLFEGKDDVMASAELASYVGDVARKARVSGSRTPARGRRAGRRRRSHACASRFAPNPICSAR